MQSCQCLTAFLPNNSFSNTNTPFHEFFNFSHEQVSENLSVSAVGKSAFKLVKLPGLKVICCQGKFVDPHPTVKTSLKFCNFASYFFAHLRPITFKHGNFTNITSWTCSFQWCQQIFPKWYISKVEKPMKGFIKGSSEFTKFI